MATMNLIPVCISTFPVILAFSVLFATIIITFLVRLYWWRRYILSLKAAGLVSVYPFVYVPKDLNMHSQCHPTISS
jgi:hypothetical protein